MIFSLQRSSSTTYTSGVASRIERTTYDYDSSGIRVSALHEVDTDADEDWDTRTLTEYLNDPTNFTGYSQVLRETNINADSDEVQKVVENTIGHDQISQTTIVYTSGVPGTPETVVFAADGHGSVRMLLNMAGAVATIAGTRQLFHYDAYGNAVGFNMSAAATTFLYSGEQFDSRIRQQYLRARYYDASTGRFNRLDPFFGNLQDPQSFHKYLYTHADPVNGVDPTGLWNLGEINVVNAIKGVLVKGIAGAALGAGIGAAIGGATSAYLHVIVNKRFDGIGTATWDGAKSGAIMGAIIGASAVNPKLLAITVGAFLGYSIAQAILAVCSKELSWDAKVAIVSLVLLQGVMSRTAIQRGITAVRDPNYSSHAEVRCQYLEEKVALQQLRTTLQNEQATTEQIARAVVELRNEMKAEARALMDQNDPALRDIKARNLREYGNELGPTPEQQLNKYGSWEAVIEAAFRTNPHLDAMYGPYRHIPFPALEDVDPDQ